jgi:hypothetical protein
MIRVAPPPPYLDLHIYTDLHHAIKVSEHNRSELLRDGVLVRGCNFIGGGVIHCRHHFYKVLEETGARVRRDKANSCRAIMLQKNDIYRQTTVVKRVGRHRWIGIAKGQAMNGVRYIEPWRLCRYELVYVGTVPHYALPEGHVKIASHFIHHHRAR